MKKTVTLEIIVLVINFNAANFRSVHGQMWFNALLMYLAMYCRTRTSDEQADDYDLPLLLTSLSNATDRSCDEGDCPRE